MGKMNESNGEVVSPIKQGKKSKTEQQETPSKAKKSKEKVEEEESDKEVEESEANLPNGNAAGSPDVSKDMFEETIDSDEKNEVEKNSSLGLDEANKVARACLLETSSDEDTVQKNQGLDKSTEKNKDKDSDSTPQETEEKSKPGKDGEEKKS